MYPHSSQFGRNTSLLFLLCIALFTGAEHCLYVICCAVLFNLSGRNLYPLTFYPLTLWSHSTLRRIITASKRIALSVLHHVLDFVPHRQVWVFIKGGCSRRGVQWMGVVLSNNTAYNMMWSTTPCFHCTPLWWILKVITLLGPRSSQFGSPRFPWKLRAANHHDTFARIRRLRKSPQYCLVILKRKTTVSATLRKTSYKR